MSRVSYKGFHIRARSYQLHDTRQWTVDLEIERKGRVRSFSLGERYATEGEAVARCVEFGRRIIDGAVPGCSVEHLR